MSFNLEQVRRIYSDPIIGKIAAFSKRIAKLESDNIEIETDDLTGYGDSDHTKVWYTDYWNFAKRYAKKTDYILLSDTDEYVDLLAQPSLWSKNLSRFSYSFWASPTTLTGTYRTPFGIMEASDVDISCYFTNVPTAAGYFIGTAVTGNDYVDGVEKFSTKPCETLGRWYHVAVVYDNAQSTDLNCLKLYVDGVLQSNAEDSETGTIRGDIIDVSSSSKALLGRFDPTSSIDNFHGRLRDFRWWSDRSLTATEALQVYQNNSKSPTPNYWLKCIAPTSGNPFDSIGNIQAFLTNGATFRDRPDVQVPFEPDYNKLRLDVRFNMLGPVLEDYSNFNNHFTVFGEPCPATGSEVFYRGGSKRNEAWSIEKPISKPNVGPVILTQPTDGAFEMINQMSWVFRLNFRSLDAQTLDEVTFEPTGSSTSQTLVEKYDSDTNKYFIRVGSDANVKAGFLDDGVETRVRTSTQPIIPGRDQLIVVTYDSGTDAVVIYVDGIVQAQTATTEGFDGSTFTTDLYALSSVQPTSGSSDWAGLCDLNYIDMLRYYDDKVLTQTHVNNLLKNCFTISSIDEDEVAITDGCIVGYIDTGLSFTDTSFTTTSYTAGP